jgi:hypothetical protein
MMQDSVMLVAHGITLQLPAALVKDLTNKRRALSNHSQ